MEATNEERVQNWLLARGILQGVIDYSKVHWDEASQTIVIPVFDKEGTFLFSKHRRAPWNDEGPKYKYEAGATAQLYNAELCVHSTVLSPFIITEGELDALLLMGQGYNAVSSTGGAGTFLPDWVPLLAGKEVYICLDTDDAGIKGSFKIQGMLPDAKIIWLPHSKDITEFFANDKFPKSSFVELIEHAKSYAPPKHIDWLKPKREILVDIKANEQVADFLLHSIDILKQEQRPYVPIEMLLAQYNETNQANRHRYKFMTEKNQNGDSKIADAKKVPITNFLDFPYTKTICCIFHEETTPSMHYYDQQNVVHCFGCSRRADVIDVVMQLRKVGLPEAIKIILNK